MRAIPFLRRLCAASAALALPLLAAAAPAPRIAIHTDDGKLPGSFTAANLSAPLKCLSDANAAPCSAWMMDVTDDGLPDVVIEDSDTVWVFTEKPAGKWLAAGQWSFAGACPAFADTMRQGRFQAITPVRPRWPDLEVAGQRFAFREQNAPAPPCPK